MRLALSGGGEDDDDAMDSIFGGILAKFDAVVESAMTLEIDWGVDFNHVTLVNVKLLALLPETGVDCGDLDAIFEGK